MSATREPSTPASKLRARLTAKAESALKREQVEFMGEKVEIRGLMTGPRGRIMDIGFKRNGDKLDPVHEKLYPAILVETLHEPTTGERIYKRGDEHVIEMMDPEEVDKVAEVAMRLSGLGNKGEIKNGSSEETEESSSSSSPETSESSSGS